MLYQDKIYEGISVELVVPEGEYKGKYRTRIEEVGTRILSVGVPVHKGQFIPLREGTAIELFFSDEFTAYSFFSSIIKRVAQTVPTFIIEFPKMIRKIQRRQYVRVPLIKHLVYRIIDKKGISEEKNGFMLDLSGGGFLLKAFENLPPNTIITIKTSIGESEIEIPGVIVRSVKEDDKDFYNVSVCFNEISERVRDKIISYVFDIQRQRRRKGLI